MEATEAVSNQVTLKMFVVETPALEHPKPNLKATSGLVLRIASELSFKEHSGGDCSRGMIVILRKACCMRQCRATLTVSPGHRFFPACNRTA